MFFGGFEAANAVMTGRKWQVDCGPRRRGTIRQRN